MNKGWSKGNVIALGSLIVALVSIPLAATTPEVRRCLGLDIGGCPFSKFFKANQSSTNPPITPSFSPKPTSTETLEEINDDRISPTFAPLKNAIKTQNWIKAERTTDNLNPKNLTCKKLKSINELWLNYSNNKFGYSVQREIWESKKINKDYRKFALATGWFWYPSKLDKLFSDDSTLSIAIGVIELKFINEPNYLEKAFQGQLPFNEWQVSLLYRKGFGDFMSKLKSCQI